VSLRCECTLVGCDGTACLVRREGAEDVSDERLQLESKLRELCPLIAGAYLQHIAEALSRAGLALVPAAAVERLAALEAQSKLYDQECGMCGSTAEELVEYQQWLERGKPTDAVTPEEREVLETCAGAEVSQLTNGWRMLDGDSNRAVAEAELARRAAKGAKGG
jgi:hypothetical protein